MLSLCPDAAAPSNRWVNPWWSHALAFIAMLCVLFALVPIVGALGLLVYALATRRVRWMRRRLTAEDRWMTEDEKTSLITAQALGLTAAGLGLCGAIFLWGVHGLSF